MKQNRVVLEVNWDRITSLDDMKLFLKAIMDKGGPLETEPDDAEHLMKTGFFKKVK